MAGATLEPTEAQLRFVKDICDTLHVDEPEEFTRESYSEFISEYKDQLYNRRNRYGDMTSNMRFLYWE